MDHECFLEELTRLNVPEEFFGQICERIDREPGIQPKEMVRKAAINLIINRDMFCGDSAYGWVRRDGVFIGCSYASHETLLMVLGLMTDQVERMGWARITEGAILSIYRLSGEQIRTIKGKGRKIDKAGQILMPGMPEEQEKEIVNVR